VNGASNLARDYGDVVVGNGTAQAQLTIIGDSGDNPVRNGGIVAIGQFDKGPELSVSGRGIRLIWYPRKAAFRAGYAYGNGWDDFNIGVDSIGLGLGVVAKGLASVAIGSYVTASGEYSTAMGCCASTGNRRGAFVIGDKSTDQYIHAEADNQFVVRATGGVYFYTGIDGTGQPNAGAYLAAGESAWSTVSDRNAKTAFEPVDPDRVLECLAGLDIEKWSYKDSKVRHMWPVAQDFYACYGLGVDNKHVTAEDMAGVAMVAIQGLHSRVEDLERENASLRARLERPEHLIRSRFYHHR
jgi:hypothetical protein